MAPDPKSGASANSATPALYGDPGGIRTPDLLIRSQTLYPAELLSHIKLFGRGSRT